MERKELFQWVLDTYGVEPDYPWKDWNAVLRHKDNQKWFGVVMEVAENKLGLPGENVMDILNVKSDPMLIGSLRQQKDFFPAYHMNKDSWISIALNGTVPAEMIEHLIDIFQYARASLEIWLFDCDFAFNCGRDYRNLLF